MNETNLNSFILHPSYITNSRLETEVRVRTVRYSRVILPNQNSSLKTTHSFWPFRKTNNDRFLLFSISFRKNNENSNFDHKQQGNVRHFLSEYFKLTIVCVSLRTVIRKIVRTQIVNPRLYIWLSLVIFNFKYDFPRSLIWLVIG